MITGFVEWYIDEHLHSGIKFVTPMQRHTGKDKIILEKRRATYFIVKRKNPERWTGNTRNLDWEENIFLNPNKKGNLLTKLENL